MTIYELSAEYLALLEMADDPDVDPEVLLDTLEALGGEIEYKADSYAKLIATINGNIAMLKEEIQRLTARMKAGENTIKRMKENLQTCMEQTGKTKFKTDLFSFGIQKNPPSVILETEDIPERYLIPQPPKIDKTQIKEDLKAGADLTGVAHLEQTQSLRIK